MYPSIKFEYIIREIYTPVLERIDKMPQDKKAEARKLKDVLIPLLIFMLKTPVCLCVY